MDLEDSVRERLKAYIYPNVVVSGSDQEAAFEDAVAAQVAFEQRSASEDVPFGDVQSYSIGNYSVTYRSAPTGEYTRATLSPATWAILFNAGLLVHALPVARRL